MSIRRLVVNANLYTLVTIELPFLGMLGIFLLSVFDNKGFFEVIGEKKTATR